ncbi:MAG: diadenylate cyclase CdaA [Proteobacteria bacterium]|nr:diadenylate cyclase CdaA [Pseudomonadota bacterium]
MSGFFNNLFDETSVRAILVTCVDILIVYYVIYRVLLMIKGTRAAQMVIGIVLIGASYLVAERLEMATVSWLLDTFITHFIIIVIVVFQQDIRRGLTRIGQRVGQFGKTHQLAHALDEVLAAAEQLAKARMGGIVVFERDADLKEFALHGSVVDARVSRELLVSLFVPSRDNALHDGAVIIDKNLRIGRAGVVLPLSRSLELGRKLGTRHRAALGITEETDAVAVVISEERGEISLCVKGNIARDLESDTLRTALQGLFDEQQTGDVAEEAHAAAEIAKAMAALAAEGDKQADNRRATTQSSRDAGVVKTPMSGVPIHQTGSHSSPISAPHSSPVSAPHAAPPYGASRRGQAGGQTSAQGVELSSRAETSNERNAADERVRPESL